VASEANTRRVAARAARYLAIALAVAAVSLAGVLLGMRVAGSDTYTTDLGNVRMEVEPALSGEVNAYVPIADWGLRANAFSTPVRLRAEALSVNRQAVLRAASGDSAVLSRAERQLDDAAGSALLREALFAIGGGVLAALAAVIALRAFGRRRRWRLLAAVGAAVTLVSVVLVVAVALLTRATFDPNAFDHPRFYAHGAELLQLLDVATQANARAERYQNKVQATLVGLSRVLAESGAGGESFASVGGARRALLASDLHANTLVVPALEELAAPERPIFFVGDFGHQGSEAEVRIVAPRLRRLGSRVIAVSGNHDSSELMLTLARAGVTVLTSDGRLLTDGTADGSPVIRVLGMKVAGYTDPLEWKGSRPDDPKRIFSFSELPDGDARRAQAEKDLVEWFDALAVKPDILLLHQNGLAQYLAATLAARSDHEPLIILTGHDHKQHVDRHDDIVVADAGSVGAGGILGVADERVAFGDLHFEAKAPQLVAVDLIEADPFSGAAQAQRVIVEGHDCPEGETECELSP
jgi:predicted phosphodiesterase